MSGSGYSFLKTALAVETGEQRPVVFRDRLNKCLLDWQEQIPVCSFATAVCLEGDSLTESYNGLPLTSGDNLCEFFTYLVAKPAAGLGSWPWRFLAQEQKSKEHGFFPPESKRIVNALPHPLWKDLDALKGALQADFRTANADERAFSWKWYAEFLALLGDRIRKQQRNGIAKETGHLIYIFGTRREFVRGGSRPARDFGLIVGLTREVENGALKTIEDNILAAWNSLVVAEHVLTDGRRIAGLESARSFSHTFRTVLEYQTGPRIRNLLAGVTTTQVVDKAVEQLSVARDLADAQAFMSQGGIKERFDPRYQDTEAYDPIAELTKFLNNAALLTQLEPTRKVEITYAGAKTSSARLSFVRRTFLEFLCVELVSNIQKHAKPGVDGVRRVTITLLNVGEEGGQLTLKIENDRETGRPVETRGGVANVQNMVEALGGTRSYPTDGGEKWTEVIAFPLKPWFDNVSSPREDPKEIPNAPPLEDVETLKQKYHWTDSSPNNPAVLRVLLLDDNAAKLDQVWGPLEGLNSGSWISYPRSIGQGEAARLFCCVRNEVWQLEIVLCRSLSDYLDALHAETFDVLLLDIDFSNDPEGEKLQKRLNGIPKLGGLIPALLAYPRRKSHCEVFTAVGAELRADFPDFKFIEQLIKASCDGDDVHFDDIDTPKELNERLCRAFGAWCVNKAADLEPTPESLACLLLALNENDSAKVAALTLHFEGKEPRRIPGKVFNEPSNGGLLLKQDRDKWIKGAGASLCGHFAASALWRRHHVSPNKFSEILNKGDDDAAVALGLEIRALGSRFGVSSADMDQILRWLRNGKTDAEKTPAEGRLTLHQQARTLFRIDLADCALINVSGDLKVRLYGLWKDGTAIRNEIRRLVAGLLCEHANQHVVHVFGESLGDHNGSSGIKIWLWCDATNIVGLRTKLSGGGGSPANIDLKGSKLPKICRYMDVFIPEDKTADIRAVAGDVTGIPDEELRKKPTSVPNSAAYLRLWIYGWNDQKND